MAALRAYPLMTLRRKVAASILSLLGLFGIYTFLFGMIVGNLTHSMMGNVYVLYPHWPLSNGTVVAFEAAKGFNPELPFIKRIAGSEGDEIAVKGRDVFINGRHVAFAKTHTPGGDALKIIASGVIPADHFFVLGDIEPSFDSRFEWVGLIPRDQIIGGGFELPFAPSARAADYLDNSVHTDGG